MLDNVYVCILIWRTCIFVSDNQLIAEVYQEIGQTFLEEESASGEINLFEMVVNTSSQLFDCF